MYMQIIGINIDDTIHIQPLAIKFKNTMAIIELQRVIWCN